MSFARPARLADWKGVRTLGYRWRDGAWQVVDVYDMEAFLGASNLYFSAADLSRWSSALARGTALPADVFAAGQQRPRIGGGASPVTGLSWYCNDLRNNSSNLSGDERRARCHYTGSINAFHSLVYWDRRREESAVMVSNGSLPPWKTISLQRALVAALAGEPADIEAPPAFGPIARKSRAPLAGTYCAAGLGDIVVTVDDANRLRMRINDGLEFVVFQVGADLFYVTGSASAADRRLHACTSARCTSIRRGAALAVRGSDGPVRVFPL